MDNFGDRLLTTAQAAEYVAMSASTFTTKRSRAPWTMPPPIKIGRCVRYRLSALDRWIDAHREGEPPED
ncbi:MAG: helix-turn-helix domain-containing protein [Nocardioidaceae bacterium]|nr:helix-turn-helix domain-containing protein [Nocardioidaceae bacterium]